MSFPPFLCTRPRYPGWRVRGEDGLWHRVETYWFRYIGPDYNTNTTFCGQTIVNPARGAFVDLHPWGQRMWQDPEPDPDPKCDDCVSKSVLAWAGCPTCGR